MFVQDKTSGIFVQWNSAFTTRPSAGQLLELDGTAALEDFAPQVDDAHWKVVGTAPFPTPQQASYPQMASTSLDSDWVEVEGVVRETAHLPQPLGQGLLWMKLSIDGGNVEVSMPWQSPELNLVDARIRLRGVCGAAFNSRNQLIGVQVYSPDRNQIDIVTPASSVVTDTAPIDQIQRFGSRYAFGQRIKTAGTVTAAMPGRGFYLRDETGSLAVLTRQEIHLVPGDRIETFGFVELFESHVRLVDASVKLVGKGAAPQPVFVTTEQALTGTYDAELVSLEGVVVRSSVWRARPTLTLHQNKDIFSISPIPGSTLGALPDDNSLLRATGILTDEIDSMGRIVAINVLCRSSSDIKVLRPAPWWNLTRALTLIGVLAALGILVLLWVVALRRKVNDQTEVIRQKLQQVEALKTTAESANRAKSEFLANISHEIRTPMNGVLGFADLLAQTPLNHEQREFLETLRSSSRSLMLLLNELLDFSKAESGHLTLEQVPFALAPCLQEVLRMTLPDAHRKNLRTSLGIATDVPESVVGDPHRLKQILLNLLTNAVKFTDQGLIQLDVRLITQDETESVLQFTVSDTGIGIPVESRNLIFEAFQQADGSTTRRYGGTGLGLAICKKLVILLGGEIWMESEPRLGSKFHFTARFKKPVYPLQHDTSCDFAAEAPHHN